ncbi:MAG: aminopeptidase P family protein, partial [Christensenellaceae bacterium]|nr:aminopeptidase P family protein [Christensenellaceae bacterium]
LNCKNNEAVVLHSGSNMFYISGYKGEGLIAIANNFKVIITDFRYTEQAENEAPDFEVLMIDNIKNHNDLLADILKSNNITKIYFEDDVVSLKDYKELKKTIENVELESLNQAPQQLRVIKDAQEVDNIKKACKITSDSLRELLPYIKEGESEIALTARLEYILKTKGSNGSAFNTICAAGANGSLPHAVPSEYRVKKGDMITFDFGAKFNGYCADMTRTLAVGTPSDTMLNVYNVVKQAQFMAREFLKAGVICKDVDAVARDYICAQGFEGRFGHGLGHSLGIDIHEEPRFNTKTNTLALENSLMTVEPGIYLPGIGGVRIEDTCFVTKEGNIPFTDFDRELIIL